jgi:hypothetical protein
MKEKREEIHKTSDEWRHQKERPENFSLDQLFSTW